MRKCYILRKVRRVSLVYTLTRRQDAAHNASDWGPNRALLTAVRQGHRLFPDSMENLKGQRVGYVRVSSYDQNPERQLDDIVLDRTFTDKASGKDTQRPQLKALTAFVRAGDTVIVHSMDRLARNLDDLRRIVRTFTQRGVRIEFVKEHLSFSGEDSPMANLMLSVMGAFAEFERALIRERQREGIALAKQRGIYRGRKPSLSNAEIIEVRRRVELGDKKAHIAREFGISRETLYQYLRAPQGDMQNSRLGEPEAAGRSPSGPS